MVGARVVSTIARWRDLHRGGPTWAVTRVIAPSLVVRYLPIDSILPLQRLDRLGMEFELGIWAWVVPGHGATVGLCRVGVGLLGVLTNCVCMVKVLGKGWSPS